MTAPVTHLMLPAPGRLPFRMACGVDGPSDMGIGNTARVTCPDCLSAMRPGATPSPRPCPDCGGTGRDLPDRGIEDGRGPIAEACDLCRGTGEAPEGDDR